MILTGGFGIRVKQYDLIRNQAITLIEELPQARATFDLDIVLSLNCWLKPEKGVAVRTMLDRLGYKVASHNWQFTKGLTGSGERTIKIDLQTTLPSIDQHIKTRKELGFGDGSRRVGYRMKTGIDALASPEGFALDNSPIAVSVLYQNAVATIHVPHPYAWLNLKVRAAHDWLREQQGAIASTANRETGDSKRLKHVIDVYILIAMITETELTESAEMAESYGTSREATKIQSEAMELYGSQQSPGTLVINAYSRRMGNPNINYDLFIETLKRGLGIAY